MRAFSILVLLALASPAFAEVTAPVQDQKPFLYDRLMPKDSAPPARDMVQGTTITAGGNAVAPAQQLPAPSR